MIRGTITYDAFAASPQPDAQPTDYQVSTLTAPQPQLYGPTSQATRSFPAGVLLTIDQWVQWQIEAQQENAAAQAPLLAAAQANILTLQAQQPGATQPGATQPDATQPGATPDSRTQSGYADSGGWFEDYSGLDELAGDIPDWLKWTAGAAALWFVWTRRK